MRFVIVFALLALTALLVAPATVLADDTTTGDTSTTATTTSSNRTLNDQEQMLLQLINKQRAKHHLHRLRVNWKLTAASRSHSQEMGDLQYFAHPSASGESWAKRICRFGYSRKGCRFWKAGEDIYVGGNIYSSAVSAVRAWMHSAPHRAVILTRSFRDVGLGAVDCAKGYKGCGDGAVRFFTIDLGRRILR